jgi:predicted HAD superfamily Cof-like phosphohydrolase
LFQLLNQAEPPKPDAELLDLLAAAMGGETEREWFAGEIPQYELVARARNKEHSSGLDACADAVRKFHRVFNHPVADSPVNLTDERAITRSGWMLAELEEFTTAENVVDRADAMIDLIYFALGTLVEMGIQPGKLFEIVQAANMAKLHNGKPQYREDNKIIKPEGWVAPEPQIAAEIERQVNARIVLP